MNTTNIILVTVIVILAAICIVNSNKLKAMLSRDDSQRMLYFLDQFRYSANVMNITYFIEEIARGVRITYSYGSNQRFFLEYRPGTDEVKIIDEPSNISDTRKLESNNLNYGVERMTALIEAGQNFIIVGIDEEDQRKIFAAQAAQSKPVKIGKLKKDKPAQSEETHAE